MLVCTVSLPDPALWDKFRVTVAILYCKKHWYWVCQLLPVSELGRTASARLSGSDRPMKPEEKTSDFLVFSAGYRGALCGSAISVWL